jgi:hypothetical protein
MTRRRLTPPSLCGKTVPCALFSRVEHARAKAARV